ncbi:4-hydroxy-tetrahydrodipicolinate synthase [Paenibacillus konkukensis]|uniref:4-hydroxy-tetrahydrodipicolinate synthase n=1 Tax=Paenibacillus konkukensis TaxID=2020716 RepID=A0ABY4RSJ0_9BACL|nr:4-hydroxy-tetrahydrodipicolinate synthase [Paenibacillus konkukensis]UQZ85088.1 4-hydroxy-tetrahydrodipicolinate synthase [Paenibacillus konkukensis]
MLTEQQLKGIYVPVITPFHPNGEVDLESFRKLADRLIADGIHGLVVNGTTGESPTITGPELEALTSEAKSAIGASRLPLVLGTGTNDTASTVKKTEQAGLLGADAALVVVPYYNKPSQQGIIEHFRRVAETGVPVILYEIPGRTGVALEVDTVRAILEMDGVIGLKDSSGGIQLVSELSRCGSKPVLCGEDAYFYASLCCGAKGGMLASAHMETARFVDIYNRFVAGLAGEAKMEYDELLPLIRLLFAEPNPAPLKWLLAEQGEIASGTLRLPLTTIGAKLQQQLQPYAGA